jgi:alpha-tubulin suppressor-like RCC1 family protein
MAYMFGKSPSSTHAGSLAGVISEQKPKRITPKSLGMDKETKFIGGAAARAHAFLVDSLGGVWGCGNNATAQLGLVSQSGYTS